MPATRRRGDSGANRCRHPPRAIAASRRRFRDREKTGSAGRRIGPRQPARTPSRPEARPTRQARSGALHGASIVQTESKGRSNPESAGGGSYSEDSDLVRGPRAERRARGEGGGVAHPHESSGVRRGSSGSERSRIRQPIRAQDRTMPRGRRRDPTTLREEEAIESRRAKHLIGSGREGRGAAGAHDSQCRSGMQVEDRSAVSLGPVDPR